MNIILTIAKENDFEELQKMQSRAFSLNINFLLEHNKNISLSSPLEIKKKYSNMIFFKIVDDNGIQGGAYVRKLNETTCEIYRIFIDLVMQHHGYGHKIIDGIIDKFQECTKFVLVTPLELSKNLCFYESCGFLSKGLKEENDLKLLIYEKSIERNAVTGLRPSRGGLHLGHWIGNIEPMLLHQNDYNCTFILADLQALNSNKEDYNLKTMYENMHFMLKQLFALGINPNKINIVIESKIKKTMLKEFLQLSNYISLN
ncbi:MAG: hypothetical protein K2P14_02525, partial [Anaeroplasmataceae bacterium]|nr:hypothetical protein [Anaeroplasmataceae bacterium]